MNKTIKIFLISLLALFFAFGTLTPSFANQDKVQQIEQKRKHAKNEIKKLRLLERIETGKLYNNQRKLEKTENSLNDNKIQYEKANCQPTCPSACGKRLFLFLR